MTPNLQPYSGPTAPRAKSTGKSLAAVLALSLSAGLSFAQTAITPASPASPATTPPTDEVVTLEEFQVKGIRASAMKAIEVKKNNPQLMEAIVSEDIGKFPDNNVAESLQRVPGIQVTGYGRGQIATVHIRGLPDITTTLNGRNIFTSTGTAYSLQDVPASLLKQVDVMKTRSASHIESGLAGILDIQTFRPFDFPGSKVGIALKGTYHEQGEKTDPNGSILFSNRWKLSDGGKLGVLLNLSHITTTYRDQSVETGARFVFLDQNGAPGLSTTPYARVGTGDVWFGVPMPAGVSSMWQAGTDAGLSTKAGSTLGQIMTLNGSATVPASILNAQYLLAPDAIIQNDSTGKTKRPAASFALQYSPNENSEYTFEMFYNGYRNDNSTNLLFTQTWEWFNVNPATVTLYPGTNLVKTRTNPNGNVWTSADRSSGKTDSILYALEGKWKITPNFNLKSEAVYQDSKFDGTFIAARTRSAYWDQVPMRMDFNAKDGMPSLQYLGWNPTQVSNWYLWNLYDNANKDKGSATTLKEEGTLMVDWPGIKRLKFGMYYDFRKAATKNRDQSREDLQFVGGWNPVPMSTLPTAAMSSITGFFDGRADIPSSWLAVNTDYLQSNPDLFRNIWGLDTSNKLQMVEVWNIDETTNAFFLQADEFRADLGGHKLTGQFGVRAVNIRTGLTFTDRTTRVQTSGRAGVSKFLPSAAFNFEITKNFIARAAYSQTIRRPGFADLNPTITYTGDLSNIGYGSASGGNQNLKPTESNNYDFGLEYYFNDSTMVHATAFRKEIDGLVVPFRKRITANIPNINTTSFLLSQPDNASNGVLKGVEIGGKYYPKNLPSFLQGFGVEGSFTNLTSSQDVPITSPDGRVVGTYNSEFFNVSNNSFSTTLAYERSRVSARLSYAWRSEFLAGNFDLAANPRLVYNRPERSVNLQVGFRIIDGLTINFEATNLTDDIQHSYYGDGPNAQTLMNRNNWIVGRTYAISTRYSF
ncbi:MAG: TonB-dependent receptor [Nibricoccus sp.]